MVRIIPTIICALFLSACSSLPDWVIVPDVLRSDVKAELGFYSFDWHLSGERQVAPIQVFDNGKKTWLQFMPDQIVPAVFERTHGGERPLIYVRQGDYLIADGVPSELSFRGGALRAFARRGTRIEQDHTADADDAVVSLPEISAIDIQDVAKAGSTSPTDNMNVTDSVPEIPGDDVRSLTRASFDAIEPTTRVDGTPDGGSGALYRITLSDRNLRLALYRWARQASWTFAPEHWAVDVDIPVSGEAIFSGSFQDAVQSLLSATELAERPLRPCFYSNHVLRVVSYSQSCDRSSGARES